MDLRRATPIVFAAFCLGLSVMVLRGQITDHPLPPVVAAPDEPPDRKEPLPIMQPMYPKTWHVAAEPERHAAVAVIKSQLAAIRAGNADKAWFYQSQALHRHFRSGQEFVAMIALEYPEFGHSASADCGPVWMNPAGDQAAVIVTVRGENGRLARGYYRLVREDGRYKVATVAGGQAINMATPRPLPEPRGRLEHRPGPTEFPRPL